MGVTKVKTEPIEDDEIKIELIEHRDDIEIHRHKKPATKAIISTDIEFFKRNNIGLDIKIEEATIRPCHVVLNRIKVEPPKESMKQGHKPAATNTIISHDLEFFDRNNIELDIKIEDTTIHPVEINLILDAEESVSGEVNDTYESFGSDTVPGIIRHETTYECFVCKCSVDGVNRLRSHMKKHRHHPVRHVVPEQVSQKLAAKAPPHSVKTSKKLTSKKSTKLFACQKCPIKFSKKVYLDLHQKTHWLKTKTFECYICKHMQTRLYNLKQHMNIHMNKRRFACDQCPRTYKLRTSLLHHKLTHNDKSIECDECDKKFWTKFRLDKHKQIHLDSRQRSFKCNLCTKSYFTKSHLQRHKSISFCNIPAGAKFECYFCHNFSYTFTALKIHMMKSHINDKTFTCEECPKKFLTQNSLAAHIKRTHTNDRPFGCSICSKRFTTKDYLSEHSRRVHLGQKPYSCNECTQTFSRKEYLMNHERSHKGLEIEKFACDKCSKKFLHISSLNWHKLIHNKERKVFPCNECGTKLSTKSSLYQHKKIHKGKPFKCDVCAKAFSYNYELKRHRRIHSGENEEKRFACIKKCKRRYRSKKECNAHQRKCNGPLPFECNICSKEFDDKNKLSTHVKLHSYNGNLKYFRYFECFICKHLAGWQHKLIKHMRTHSGEKPFKCDEIGCNAASADKYRLMLHKRLHRKTV